MSSVDTTILRQCSSTVPYSHAEQTPRPASATLRRFALAVGGEGRWLPLCLTLCAALGALLLPATLSGMARLSLFVFACSVILWTTTRLEASYVALLALLPLSIAQPGRQEMLFEALASDIVWLMISAFVLGGAMQVSGLAERLTGAVARRARSVGGVCWLLTTVLIPLTIFIPSTSGTAATALPLFRSLTAATNDRRVTRALALLIPVVTLVATISTLVGAGSHLIANDLLQQATGRQITFAQWALYGVPFGLLAAYLSCWIITRLFLTPELRRRELRIAAGPRTALARAERITLVVVAAMLALWLTEHWHGLSIATVGVLGALALTAPGIGVFGWKEALKHVSWNLILFVGAASIIGRALIESGASRWILDHLFALSGLGAQSNSSFFVIAVLAALTLTSHVYMTSHTARAAAFIPALLTLAASLHLDATAMVFIGTVGMDYCLTFPVSSKALLVFAELDGDTFRPADLLRLSAVLLAVHFALIVLFCFTYWRWVGLSL